MARPANPRDVRGGVALATLLLLPFGVHAATAPPAGPDAIGPAALDAKRAEIEAALGKPAESDPEFTVWRRTLWTLPDPEDGKAPPIAVPEELTVAFEDGKVRSAQASFELAERPRRALLASPEVPPDAAWPTRGRAALGITLDRLIELYGVPTVVPALPSGTDEKARVPAPEELDDSALDLRYRGADGAWLFFVVTDLDPRPGMVNLRLTNMRLEKPLR